MYTFTVYIIVMGTSIHGSSKEAVLAPHANIYSNTIDILEDHECPFNSVQLPTNLHKLAERHDKIGNIRKTKYVCVVRDIRCLSP